MSKRDIKKNKNTQTKSKQPMTLAKDKNQLIMAAVVLCLFAIVSIYNISVYVKDQQPMQPSSSTTAGTDPVSQDEMMRNKGGGSGPKEPGANTPNQAQPNNSGTSNPSSTAKGMLDPVSQEEGLAPQPVGPPPPEPFNPTLPILLVVLITGLVMKVLMSKKKSGASEAPPKNNNKNSNNSGREKKFTLAKDKNQLIAAVVVFALFAGTTIYNVVIYIKEQQPAGPIAAQNMDQAAMMAAKQQRNLESLGMPGSQNAQDDADDIYSKTLSLQNPNGGATQSADPMMQNATGANDEIEVMSKKQARTRSGKMVMIPVSDSGRSNPFLPAAENITPSSLPKFNILPPPETASTGSDADNVMSTVISGILYDKYSPSAILNIGGTDYLVKKGDSINRYKVLSISKDQVTVQLGQNIYRAGVGEILAQGTMNYNTISNLDKKFGGNSVSIGVRKKGY